MYKLLGALLVGLAASPTLAGTPERLAADAYPFDLLKAARAGTVRILDPSTDPPLMGTAVLLAPGRHGSVLLLTARHLIRQREQPLEVDSFASPDGKATRFPGRAEILADNPRADLVLVRFSPGNRKTGGRTPPALTNFLSICPPDQLPEGPMPVWALGCPRGADPRWQATRITGTKAVKGGTFFVVAKQPVEGRSGGPLIDALSGHVLGICSAADRGTGLYAHLTEIHAMLTKAGITAHAARGNEADLPKEAAATRGEDELLLPQPAPARPEGRGLPGSERSSSWDLLIDVRRRPDGSREVSVQSGRHRFAHIFPP